MTNGEKIKETFPNMRITVCEFYIQVMGEKYEFNNTYPLDWWNAEYEEPRKGHWKLVQRGKEIDVCCSNCEAVRIKGWAYNYTIDELTKEDINECFGSAEMRFCPNCGADMREVEE